MSNFVDIFKINSFLSFQGIWLVIIIIVVFSGLFLALKTLVTCIFALFPGRPQWDGLLVCFVGFCCGMRHVDGIIRRNVEDQQEDLQQQIAQQYLIEEQIQQQQNQPSQPLFVQLPNEPPSAPPYQVTPPPSPPFIPPTPPPAYSVDTPD